MIASKAIGHSAVKESNELCGEILGSKIVYRLYMIELCEHSLYAVYVEYGDEFDARFVGSDVFRAQEIYNLICRNEVTPCTFGNVIDEICSVIN